MRPLISVGLMVLLGCATIPSVHEYCEKNAANYPSYSECYAEESARRERSAAQPTASPGY